MATLVSPGVAVPVTDESAYASSGAGTIPLIIIATRENKVDPTGTYTDGIAQYTKSEFSGEVVPVTSQREITQFFGEAIFRSDGPNVVEGAETSEYGLHAAYSYLGQGNQAYIVRADVDLDQLVPSITEPSGPVSAGAYWLALDESDFGVFSYSGSAWLRQPVTVEVVPDATSAESAGSYAPAAPGTAGDYLVAVVIEKDVKMSVYYYKFTSAGSWESLTSTFTEGTVTFAPHYATPGTPATDDVWIKTTSPGNGINLSIYRADFNGIFSAYTVEGVSDAQGSADYIHQDGTSLAVIDTLTNLDVQLTLNDATVGGFEIQNTASNQPVSIAIDDKHASIDEPVGPPADGQLWANEDQTDLDILIRANGGWERINEDRIQYATAMPISSKAGGALTADDIWIDTSANSIEYPSIYRFNGSAWMAHDNTNQSSDEGVLFDSLTDEDRYAVPDGIVESIPGSPDYQLYPTGILAVNMHTSSNTVRAYNSDLGVWRNAAANRANGSGRFGAAARRNVIVIAMAAVVVGNEDLRDQSRNFTLISAPNFPELTDELVTLNTDRGETAFIIGDTPMNITPQRAVSWIQGIGATENGEEGLVTKNTYSAFYYPSGRSTAPNGQTVTVPSSHMALYTYAYNDNVAYPWFAPAGSTRGQVFNASALGYVNEQGQFREVALNDGQRDAMYLNKLNPIANFPGENPQLFGQKTMHNVDSALDRVNVARLVAYLRERLSVITRPFIFEPNDEATRTRIKNVVEGFLSDILSKRGIYDFVVVCDRSNNTNLRIDRNELWVDVAIEPAKAAEFIYIPVRLVNTGALSG